jgi:hypothetical protein
MTIGRNETAAGEILVLRKEGTVTHGFGSTDSYLLTNVGIGTATPQKKVHIEGTGGASEMQILVSSASDTVGHTAGIGLRGEGGEADGDLRIKGGIFFERIAGSFGNGKMILAVNSSVSNTSVTVADHALTIDTNKNVGIGITGPQSKLQVAGGIQMADDTDTAVVGKVGTMRYRTGTEYVEVTGTELVTNGDFASSTGWVLKNSASINNGTGVATVPGAGALSSTNANWSLSQASVFAVSTLYRLRFQARRDSGTASEMYVGQSYSLKFNQVLTAAWVQYEAVFTSTSNVGWSDLSFGGVVGTTSEVKEVSVMEVIQEDTSYADMCMQTGSSTYEWVNIVRNTY